MAPGSIKKLESCPFPSQGELSGQKGAGVGLGNVS